MPTSATASEPPASAVLQRLPEALRPALHAILARPKSDAALILAQFVASFVHPDFVCNLSLLDALPAENKQAALAFFNYCLNAGMTLEEQGDVLRLIQPHMARILGVPPMH